MTKTPKQLITNVIGQLEGVSRMMDEQKECSQVLTQLKAAKAGLGGVMQKYLELNLAGCMKKNLKVEEKDKMRKLIEQLIKVN